MGKIKFFLGEALRSLRRNYFMTIAALVTVFLSMTVLGVVMVFAYNIEALLKDVEQKVEISVYLQDTAKADEIESLQKEIVGWSEVNESVFMSKEDALKKLKEDLKDHPGVLENLSSNPLPASFEISLKDPEAVEAVAARFAGKAFIDSVSYGKEIAERIFRVTSLIRNVLVVFIILLGGVSVLLISNTIRLSIYARRREVEIMKLVGATNWFIRWPFVIEGLAVGVVGAVGALTLVLVGTDLVLGRIREYTPFLTVPFDAVSPLQLSAVLLGVGAVIGALGSGLGLRRFLNV